MRVLIDTEREDNGRWIADVTDLPGVIVYGATREESVDRVKAPALRVLAERSGIPFQPAKPDSVLV